MTRLAIVPEQFFRTYTTRGTREYYLIMSKLMLITRFKKCCFKFCVRLSTLVG